MWHELVLNGIGGRTIAEAQERMTYAEAYSWYLYIRKHGSLNIGSRLEYGFALIAKQINRALGGKAEITDFMPHFEPVAPSLDEAVESWI